MSFPEEIRRIRERSFLSQEAFAKELGVSFSTVNRWEAGRTKPNLAAMKNIKNFCLRNEIEYKPLEEKWLALRAEDSMNG